MNRFHMVGDITLGMWSLAAIALKMWQRDLVRAVKAVAGWIMGKLVDFHLGRLH